MPEEKNNLLCFLDYCYNVIDGHYGSISQVIGILALVLICNFFIKAILFRLYKRYEKQQKIWALSFVSALYKPLTYLAWFAAALASLDLISFGLFSFHLANMHLVLSIASVLAFGWFLLRWNNKFFHYSLELSRNNQLAVSASKLDVISKVATIVTLFITVFLLMDVTGRNMHTLIAFGGIGGLALAFASQQVVANFL
jgi:MscS family membrane protein